MDKAVQEVIKKHMETCEQWKEGKPVKVFLRDGYTCVKYESGAWWHYNLKTQTWF